MGFSASCICPQQWAGLSLKVHRYLFTEDGQGQMTEEGCGKRANVVRLPQNTLQAPGICGSGSS